MKWFEIFRTGTHTDANGKEKKWTEQDLEKMVNFYSPGKHEAPIVVGHPKDNAPAYGWIDQLKVAGGRLLALPRQLDPQFADMVRAGRFKKRSISVYPDGTLRHVGFLGAQPPAIKGLKDVSFSDEQEAQTYEYKELEETMPTVEELQAKLDQEKAARKKAEEKSAGFEEQVNGLTVELSSEKQNAKRREIDNFIESGIESAKILPAWKDKGLAEFMVALDEHEQSYEFAEGEDKQTPAAWFKEFLQEFAEHPLFKVMARPKDDAERKDDADYAEDVKIAREIAGVEEDA